MSILRSHLVPPILLSNKPLQRSIAISARHSASVTDSNTASASISLSSSASSSSSSDDLPPLRSSIYGSRELLEAKRERKFAQYEKMLAEKAKRDGFGSVSELRARQEEIKAAKAKAKMGYISPAASGMTDADAKVAAGIRKRIEEEAERKLRSEDFSSGPGIKSLSDIIDTKKIEADSPAKISQLWTQYHTLKNKISAVIPVKQYAQMVSNAREYPNFILPLPRTIVGSLEGNESDTANVAPGEQKQGYEMQYLQWSFLPRPEKSPSASANPVSTAESLSQQDEAIIEKAVPSTVLFTPLAEYKLRQEYAQPVLILTHYTDLAKSKGIVLLRGEITGAEEATAGIAAAAIASKTGQASAEKIETFTKPLQSQGKLSPQDAQLLTVTLQRLYMPKASNVDLSKIPGEKERQELLFAFHNDQNKFDIDKLCTYALLT